jgi:Spy/CpxP family protein refolding chaperone
MIRMTLSALALAVAVALPATSRAQQASTDSTPSAVQPHRHHRFGHRLFKDVNLTKDERGQVKSIHQKYAPQFKTARQSNDKATIQSLRTQELDEMRGVLTPDQQTKFDANRAAIRAHFKQQAPSTPPSSN